jgi:hypothetical protein
MMNRNRAADLAACYADAAAALLRLASAARVAPAANGRVRAIAADADRASLEAARLLESAHSIAREALPPRVAPADVGGGG